VIAPESDEDPREWNYGSMKGEPAEIREEQPLTVRAATVGGAVLEDAAKCPPD
jgi:hypothetical protein